MKKIKQLLKNPIFILTIIPLALTFISLIYVTGPLSGVVLPSMPEGRGWPFIIIDYDYYFPEGVGGITTEESYKYYNVEGINFLGLIGNYIVYFIITAITYFVSKITLKLFRKQKLIK